MIFFDMTWTDRHQRISFPFVVLILAVLSRFVWLGDIPFICDEPLLIGRSLDALSSGVFPTHGLMGTRGIEYGPIPTWLYAVLLSISHDVFLVSFAKLLLITVGTVWALKRLQTLLPQMDSRWFFFPLLSPYLWFYSRDLWDNSWLTATNLLCMVLYLDSLWRERRSSIFWLGVAAACSLGTHLMGIPLIAAIAVHLVWRERESLLSNAGSWVAGVVAALLILSPYILHLWASPPTMVSVATPDRVGAFLEAWLGIRFFSAVGFEYFLGHDWLRPVQATAPVKILSVALIAGTALILVAYLAGLVSGIQRFIRGDRSQESRALELSLLALLFHAVLTGWQGVKGHPHYYSGIWPAVFLVTWEGMGIVSKWRTGRGAIAIWAVCSLAVLIMMPGLVHLRHGSRSLHYGPTLQNLWEISRTMNQGNVTRWSSEAAHPRDFPQSLDVLRRLGKADTAVSPRQARIVYLTQDPWDGAMGAVLE